MPTTEPTPNLPAPSAPDNRQWLKNLKAQVTPPQFQRGRELAEGGHVTLLWREDTAFAARVFDPTSNDLQSVEARGDEGRITSACTCPVFRPETHCEHVVAAALIYLTRAKQDAAAPPNPAEVALPGLAKLESWLGFSAQPDYDFLYRITPAQTGTGTRHWVLDVRRQDAQAKGPAQVKRLLSAGARLAPSDERIFLELARFESRFDGRLVLSDEDLGDVLELLRHRKVIYRGTALIYADESARPQIRLESRTDGASARIDLQLPAGTTVGLKDSIVLAGRRTWAIVGQTLYAVEPELPPRLVRKWLLEPSMSFPPGQVDRVLGFFAAHLPRFRMGLMADGLDVEENTQPQFVLTLDGGVERIKAQLAARYGDATVPVSPTAMHLGYATAGPGTGKKLYRRRDELERDAGKLLVERGFKYDSNGQSYDASGDTAIAFWAHGQNELPANWETFAASPHKVRVRAKIKPRIRVGMSGVNWFELDAQFLTEDQNVDLGAIRMWLGTGRRFIALKDGSFAEADREELKRTADLLEEAGAAAGKNTTRLPLYQAPALEMLASLGESTEIETRARKAMLELRELEAIPVVRAPEGLQATLRHYQESGLSWLWFLHRHGLSGILADDMGLGKTIQALALMQKARNEDGSRPSLVVAPTSVLANWEREAERFTPALKTFVWHGQDRKEFVDQLQHTDLVLTSYALVRRDIEELSKLEYRYVVLDEAQNIKNADSATAQACKTLPSEQRLALTGTPLENRLSELWSIFDFLMPGFLGGLDTFGERYEQPIQVAGDIEVRDRLKRRIHPFILRRLKTEVAKDLPPKTETVAYCEMDSAQTALYREVLDESRRKVFDSIEKVGFGKSRVSILAALMRLRQVCCDPRLLKLPPSTPMPPSAKLERCGELISDLIAEGHRALVFSQFTEMLELLKQQSDQNKVPYLYLDGRTRDRMAKVDEFNDPKGPPLFFISLKAGGTGLNLTAADYVIHYDPWWNPAVEDQATDRTHRIGQTRAVISYKLITRNTVEEKILALQKRKRELAQGVLGGDIDLGKTLSEQDVQELFLDN